LLAYFLVGGYDSGHLILHFLEVGFKDVYLFS